MLTDFVRATDGLFSLSDDDPGLTLRRCWVPVEFLWSGWRGGGIEGSRYRLFARLSARLLWTDSETRRRAMAVMIAGCPVDETMSETVVTCTQQSVRVAWKKVQGQMLCDQEKSVQIERPRLLVFFKQSTAEQRS